MEEYLFGNLKVSIVLFITTFACCYLLMRWGKPNSLRLKNIDIFWQISLFIGIILATGDLRRSHIPAHYEFQIGVQKHSFDNLYDFLDRRIRDSHYDIIRGRNYNSIDTVDYKLALNWYTEKKKLLDVSKLSLTDSLNRRIWEKVKNELSDFSFTNKRYISQNHEYIQRMVIIMDDDINQILAEKAKRKEFAIETFLRYISPWILSIILGLRLAKSFYERSKLKNTLPNKA